MNKNYEGYSYESIGNSRKIACEDLNNPLYYPGVVDMCAPIPLHHNATVAGKVAGVLSIAGGIKNCVSLLHSPVGCAFQRRINSLDPWEICFDMPCSGITEMDTVYGGSDRLYYSIKEVVKKYKPELIMVVSTCTPDLIGDDIESVIRDVREEM